MEAHEMSGPMGQVPRGLVGFGWAVLHGPIGCEEPLASLHGQKAYQTQHATDRDGRFSLLLDHEHKRYRRQGPVGDAAALAELLATWRPPCVPLCWR